MTQRFTLSTDLLETLLESLKCELQRHPNGIKEYELLQNLKPLGYFKLSDDSCSTPHELFQAHFLLFHALYVLRNQLLVSKQGWLEIEALNIQLLPYQQGTDALTMHDRLAEYYLDLTNLEHTSNDDVNKLIASFWTRLNKHDKRDEALAALGLKDPVSNSTIKETYRKLAMEHHPDRGGDNTRLQAINNAISILLK